MTEHSNEIIKHEILNIQSRPKKFLNFLSELRQISTKFNNFWHAYGQDNRSM